MYFFQKKQLIEFLALTFPDPYHGYQMIKVIFVSVLWNVNTRQRVFSFYTLFSPQEARSDHKREKTPPPHL